MSNPDKNAAEEPGVQGEGDYVAARRYQKDTESFIEQGKVAAAAAKARPANAEEAAALQQAEEAGRSRTKGEDADIAKR